MTAIIATLLLKQLLTDIDKETKEEEKEEEEQVEEEEDSRAMCFCRV